MTTSIQLPQQSNIQRIDHLVLNPPPNSRVFEFTADEAREILTKYNKGNRAKKARNIERYAEDLTAGRWYLSGDTLKFSDAHLLRDGQNRLEGLIMAQEDEDQRAETEEREPVELILKTHVIFGIPDEAFAFLDRGKNRDGGDVLGIAGVASSGQVAAAVKWAERLGGDPMARDTLEPHEILSIYKARYEKTELQERLSEARAIYATTKHPIGFVAALLWHLRNSDPRKAAEFARAWEARGVVKSGRQGRQLAAMIGALDKLKSVSQGRIHDTVRAAWAVQAWNGFKVGKRLNAASFTWNPTTDDFPDID